MYATVLVAVLISVVKSSRWPPTIVLFVGTGPLTQWCLPGWHAGCGGGLLWLMEQGHGGSERQGYTKSLCGAAPSVKAMLHKHHIWISLACERSQRLATSCLIVASINPSCSLL
jgi:hypothetical protein